VLLTCHRPVPCCVAQDGDPEPETTLEIAEEKPRKKARRLRRQPDDVSFHASKHSEWYACYVLRLQKACYKAAKRANAGAVTTEYLGPIPPPNADAFLSLVEGWFGVDSYDDEEDKSPLITTTTKFLDIEAIVELCAFHIIDPARAFANVRVDAQGMLCVVPPGACIKWVRSRGRGTGVDRISDLYLVATSYGLRGVAPSRGVTGTLDLGYELDTVDTVYQIVERRLKHSLQEWPQDLASFSFITPALMRWAATDTHAPVTQDALS
jgi:hypothetical protein